MAPGDLITSDGQIEWRGLLLGAGTAYGWRELTGLRDLPGIGSGNMPRPGRHGSWAGRALADERILTYTTLVRSLVADFPAAVLALSTATVLDEDGQEEPLVVSVLAEQRLLFGQPTSRLMPVDKAYRVGHGNAVLQWTCADPRLYSLEEHSTQVPQPAAGAGLVYPLTYPLTYGTADESGSRQLVNAGDVPTSPVLAITGPCTTPSVVLVATGQLVEFSVTLAASETLTVDTGAGTVLLGGVADRLSSLTARSVPVEAFELPPGSSEVAFRAVSFTGGATVTVTWRDAWM